ncbi:MAG: tRNA (uridine(34)/cytosine(34)/5-carboxymethylaminomethyluridine(34)-2'-O)-methyltransferase TrmL [Clostridia bacterium]|nr:tRNA (uridine(34)/cytosine(34)/5-carboxymethylaminomethyluridine(34)-2'-O)-methyltransferase TrmL [Clostridia bacterium]
MLLNIVLVEPEIPQNTGNIARTCACTGAQLHLVKPLGFELDDRKMKRAGLDYWPELNVRLYENFDELRAAAGPEARFWFFTTKGSKRYTDAAFRDGDYLVFGRETHGLPEPLLKANYDRCLRIPMGARLRSLNLSNSVAIAVYEALRQSDFTGLESRGHLTGRAD